MSGINKKGFVYVFSGQGSQHYQMAKELYQTDHLFQQKMDHLDDIAGDYLGESVIRHFYDEDRTRSTPFHNLRFSHPAIAMVEFALFEYFLAHDIYPDAVLGASLGEFIAAAAAGVITAEQMMQMVIAQATEVQWQCAKGGMLAVLSNIEIAREAGVLLGQAPQEHISQKYCTIAARNYAEHFVVSGSLNAIHSAEALLRKNIITFQSLPVDYGFHSSGIDKAKAYFLSKIAHQKFSIPATALISSCYCAPVNEVTHEYFWNVVRKPIEFETAIQYMESQGDYHYIDLGASGTLSNFIKRSLTKLSRSKVSAVLNSFGSDVNGLNRILTELSVLTKTD